MSLEYDISYHRHCRFSLASGLAITLEALHQWATYQGLIGVPFDRVNDRLIEGTLHTAQTYCVEESRPYLVSPRSRDYLRQPDDMVGVTTVGGGVAQWLPVVTCVGIFKDVSPVRDKSLDQSYLTVVWFQDEFAFPMDTGVLEHLRSCLLYTSPSPRDS